MIDGLTGVDETVIFGNEDQFLINELSGVIRLQTRAGNTAYFEEATKILNVENIHFSDSSIAINLQENNNLQIGVKPAKCFLVETQ